MVRLLLAQYDYIDYIASNKCLDKQIEDLYSKKWF